ncbi:MAG: nicotinate-nucleotide adenylyltransferase [Gammaproteobacteria bacterium]|nr:nicotinate-nucleotide adenylyltransferase [Gammaproteobacteria bacterium]
MIGLLGGTFDPIHYGHLRPAHEVKERLALSAVHLIPAAVPPHRAPPIATAAQRLRMVELAVAEFPGLIADDCELRRGNVSYTVTTLAALRAELGSTPLCLLLGTDAFAGLATWHRWQELFELAHLVVMQRPGQALPVPAALPVWARQRLQTDAKNLAELPAGGILFVDVTPHSVSATELRATIARGEEPLPTILPPAVWDYIRHNRLYRSLVA